jgi:hypothetical protein
MAQRGMGGEGPEECPSPVTFGDVLSRARERSKRNPWEDLQCPHHLP